MVGVMGSSLSSSALVAHPFWWGPIQKVEPTPINPFTTAASLRHVFLLRYSLKKLSHLYHAPRLKDVWCKKASRFKEFNLLQFSNDIFASTCSSWLFLFNGGDIRKDSGNERAPPLETSRRNSLNGRQWTNILLAINILVYGAQTITRGKLLFWGAKVNSLIDKGQFWRLATSSFLHANIGHLLVNCYSLNSIGPTIENLSGPKRFLAVYFASAIASSATSYWFCKAPAVGASGAVFGLVGSLAVFVIRHRGMIGGGREELQHIAQVIFLNMTIGLLSKGIDNWGHFGGLLGGVATSWFVGPAWKYEPLLNDCRRIFVDKAPIRYLTNRKTEPRKLS